MPSMAQLLEGIAPVPPQLADVVPTGLRLDSRAIAQGECFVALAGQRGHGLAHASQALDRGAAGVIYDAPAVPETLADLPGQHLIAVPNLRKHLGVIADRAWHSPSKALTVVGVTGTNGKTSTVYLLAQALTGAGVDVASIGTLGTGRPGALVDTGYTTPDVLTVHAELRRFVDADISHVAMEVSSHALDQGRVDQVTYAIAVFTNLTRDHLDYHGDMAGYGAAKARLFAWPGLGHAVINTDDAFGRQLSTQLPDGVVRLRYGLQAIDGAQPEITAGDVVTGADGLRFTLRIGTEATAVATRLLGRFNVANLLAVAGCLHALDWAMADIAAALAKLDSVPGRMNRYGGGDKPLVVVDYAHTPDALEQALRGLREHEHARLHCVFGCGGERDTGKRPQMAAAAQALADRIIVTDDNPRHENGDDIVDDILAGLDDDGLARTTVERDRARAIATAVAMAGANDIVLIAGKGHEPYQDIAGVKRPFDDGEQARTALQAWSC